MVLRSIVALPTVGYRVLGMAKENSMLAVVESILSDGKVAPSEVRVLLESCFSTKPLDRREEKLVSLAKEIAESPSREDLRHFHMALLEFLPEEAQSASLSRGKNSEIKEVSVQLAHLTQRCITCFLRRLLPRSLR